MSRRNSKQPLVQTPQAAPRRRHPETDKAVVNYLLIYPPGDERKFKQCALVLFGRKATAEKQVETLKNLAALYMRLHGLSNLPEAAEKLVGDILNCDWKKLGGRELLYKFSEEKEVTGGGPRKPLPKAIVKLVEDGQRQKKVVDYESIVEATYTVTFPNNPERTKTRMDKHKRLVRGVLRHYYPALLPGKKGGN